MSEAELRAEICRRMGGHDFGPWHRHKAFLAARTTPVRSCRTCGAPDTNAKPPKRNPAQGAA